MCHQSTLLSSTGAKDCKALPTKDHAQAQPGCTEAVCGIVEDVTKVNHRWYRLSVNIGDDISAFLPIMTTWANVTLGQRVAIAVVGSCVGDFEVVASERGGVVSQGNLCDGKMLGWAVEVANPGVAVSLNSSFQPGDAAPAVKPSRQEETGSVDTKFGNKLFEEGATSLYAAPLTKEQKRDAKREKKRARSVSRESLE